MGYYHYNEANSPIMVLTTVGSLDDDAFSEHLDFLAGRTGEGHRFRHAIIVDARRGKAVNARQRRRQSEFINRTRDYQQAYSVGTAFILENALLRGALTAIMWVSPNPVPFKTCASLEDGFAWTRAQLAAQNIATPETLGPGTEEGRNCWIFGDREAFFSDPEHTRLLEPGTTPNALPHGTPLNRGSTRP